jgi:hypothetical protein
MNAEQMRSALAAFADLVGGGRRADVLNGLAQLFEGLGSAKVAKIVATIEINWRSANRRPRHSAELKAVLVDLQRAFALSGAKTQASDIATLLRLFDGAGDQSVEAFVEEAIASRVTKSQARGAARTKSPFTKEKARELADQLSSAADDRKRFETLLDQLKGQFKVDQLRAIAGFYTGYETAKTKKDDIISAIRHWHREGEMNRDRRAAQAKAGL